MPNMVNHEDQNDDLWVQLRDALQDNLGLYFRDERLVDLKRGLSSAATEFGFYNSEECVRWLLSEPLNQTQIEILATHLSVGETYFFRDQPSFEILKNQVLPKIIKARAKKDPRIRIWSVGCSTGEEPYSIAMVLTELITNLCDWNITILGTDIVPGYLQKATIGDYSQWSFRNIPKGIQEKFFTNVEKNRYTIKPKIKSMVTFLYHNLIKDAYPSVDNGTNAMDIIFCRNVLMYFKHQAACEVLTKLSQSLVEGGWLFSSPTDIIACPQFPELIPFPDTLTTLYRKKKMIIPPLEKVETAVSYIPLEPVLIQPEKEALPAQKIYVEDPEETLKSSPSCREIPFSKAKKLYQQGFYEPVLPAIKNHLLKNPNDSQAMGLLARCYANLGLLQEAQIWCGKALSIDKMNWEWWFLSGTIYQEQKLIQDAINSLKHALYLDMDNPLLHFSLGNLYRENSSDQDARRYFNNALMLLKRYDQNELIQETEGITAGRLSEWTKAFLPVEDSYEK